MIQLGVTRSGVAVDGYLSQKSADVFDRVMRAYGSLPADTLLRMARGERPVAAVPVPVGRKPRAAVSSSKMRRRKRAKTRD